VKSLFWLMLAASLAGCTFGVPIGGNQPAPMSGGKSKYGNPESYVVHGKRYYVMDSADGFVQRGIASWYGPKFHGRRTSSGETYNMNAMTAAHKSLPLPTMVRVTNLENGKTAVVKVNDRGPFAHDRIIDLSRAAAQDLGVIGPGTAEVEIVALTNNKHTAMVSAPAGPKAGQPVVHERPLVRAIPLKTATTREADLYIQVASFSAEMNAISLRNQLKGKDETAIVISPTETDSGTYYRVQIGPLLDVSEADSVQKRLAQKGYANTRIVVGE
jgi:rare lipoprotein A